MLILALEKIDDYNKGFSDFSQIEDVVQEFLFQSQVFAHKSGNFKVDRKAILKIELTLKALGDEFEQRWNEERRKEVTEELSVIDEPASKSDEEFISEYSLWERRGEILESDEERIYGRGIPEEQSPQANGDLFVSEEILLERACYTNVD